MDSVLIIKVFSALVYPIGMSFVLAVVSMVWHCLKHPMKAKMSAWLAVLILLFASNPMVSRYLAYSLERQFPSLEMASISEHDAIIVLGGGLRLPTPPATYPQLTNSSDRYWYASKLYKNGKAKRIILSGGNLYAQSGLHGEAYYASQLLQQWGVPKSAIEIETQSRTTAQNYQNIRRRLESQSIKSALLVSSAIHMPRAYTIFEQLPITLSAAPADIIVRYDTSPLIFNFLPSASALNLSTQALHEYYGLYFAWLKRQF